MDYTLRSSNNFNLVRMIAAYMVIIAHAYAIQGMGGADFVVLMTGCTHLGQMAVYIFVFLSGVFITKSLLESDNNIKFILKRIARIYPALIICLLAVIIMGACFTTLELSDYITNPQTVKYFSANITMIFNEHILPGVFENHPNQGVNGVLWYLTFELRVYLIGAILNSFGLLKEKSRANIILIILLCWVIAKPEIVPLLGSDVKMWGNVDFPQYTITTIIAGLFYINVPSFQFNWKHLVVVFSGMLLFRHTPVALGVWACGFIIISLWIGTNTEIIKIKCPDYSYGIFLYGFPVGQVIKELLPNTPAIIAMIPTAVIATVIAYISTKYLEKPISDFCIKKINKIK